jgi:peptide/nickel transport system ATP-binding protein
MRLEAKDIDFRYPRTDKWILKGINLSVEAGERVALVGPSGCGKSTLAGILSGCLTADAGAVLWDGRPLPDKGYCPVQLIRQHPELSVNPRWKMDRILRESWAPDEELLNKMGLEDRWMTRRPSELSGGELQRFCIARVLGPHTKFLICDEISTMLDAITQAQIWRLLLDATAENGVGLLVVTHNPELATRVCDRRIDLNELNVAFS